MARAPPPGLRGDGMASVIGERRARGGPTIREGTSGTGRQGGDRGGRRAAARSLVGYHFWTDLWTLLVAVRDNISW
jgi:hypothetical protein